MMSARFARLRIISRNMVVLRVPGLLGRNTDAPPSMKSGGRKHFVDGATGGATDSNDRADEVSATASYAGDPVERAGYAESAAVPSPPCRGRGAFLLRLDVGEGGHCGQVSVMRDKAAFDQVLKRGSALLALRVGCDGPGLPSKL